MHPDHLPRLNEGARLDRLHPQLGQLPQVVVLDLGCLCLAREYGWHSP